MVQVSIPELFTPINISYVCLCRMEQTQLKGSKTWSPPWGKLEDSRNGIAAALADSSQTVYCLQGYTSQLRVRDILQPSKCRPEICHNRGTY